VARAVESSTDRLIEMLPVTERMPVLFLGHGSPINAVEDNEFTRALEAAAADLPRPEAIMVVSGHWLTESTVVTCGENPRTIHDFLGFPEELYHVTYPAPGAPSQARAALELTKLAAVACDFNWGFDHASWAPLRHMFPKADIPMFEMSLDVTKPPGLHYSLAAHLQPLRMHGVLVVGSGNIVHNLGRVRWETDAEPYPWAVEFDEIVKAKLLAGDHDALVDYKRLGPSAQLAVPTPDHYLPMLYALGLQLPEEPLSFIYEGFQNASVSMRCFRIG
jgi:4,5-DOPA dioxygenase extradiol